MPNLYTVTVQSRDPAASIPLDLRFNSARERRDFVTWAAAQDDLVVVSQDPYPTRIYKTARDAQDSTRTIFPRRALTST